jgi:hypothetical protein
MFTISTIDPTEGLGYAGLKSRCRLDITEYYQILGLYSNKNENWAEAIADICLAAYSRKHKKARQKFYDVCDGVICINYEYNIKRKVADSEEIQDLGILCNILSGALDDDRHKLTYSEIGAVLDSESDTAETFFLTREHYLKFMTEVLDSKKADQLCVYSFDAFDIINRSLKSMSLKGKINYTLKDILAEF